jgi:hypothetical protein
VSEKRVTVRYHSGPPCRDGVEVSRSISRRL